MEVAMYIVAALFVITIVTVIALEANCGTRDDEKYPR